MDEGTSGDEGCVHDDGPDTGSDGVESADVRLSGFTGWLMGHPFVALALGAIAMVALGAMLLQSNPASRGMTGDDFGPSRPLRGDVIVVAVLCFVSAGVLIALGVAVAVKRHRASKRRATSAGAR
ncbi:unannotated protein [freshwater metagenome]|uniref:Unannotated protein n=1 Tax=freshwater metagenome TaxID=449393 RepID=A0A6J7KXC6_9ZZZZ